MLLTCVFLVVRLVPTYLRMRGGNLIPKHASVSYLAMERKPRGTDSMTTVDLQYCYNLTDLK